MTSMVERCTSAARARSSAKAAAVSTSADCSCAFLSKDVDSLCVWVWNDWDKNVRTTQNQYAYTISLVSKLLCATACWSSNARRRWCSGSICQEALPCSCWASCLTWQQKKLPVHLQGIKKLSSSEGNHFPIEDFEHSSEARVHAGLARSWTVGWKRLFHLKYTM